MCSWKETVEVLPAIGDREKLIGLDKNGAMNIAGQKIDPAPYFTKDEIASFQKRGDLASVTVVRPGHGLSGSTTDQLPDFHGKRLANQLMQYRIFVNRGGIRWLALELCQPLLTLIGTGLFEARHNLPPLLERASTNNNWDWQLWGAAGYQQAIQARRSNLYSRAGLPFARYRARHGDR